MVSTLRHPVAFGEEGTGQAIEAAHVAEVWAARAANASSGSSGRAIAARSRWTSAVPGPPPARQRRAAALPPWTGSGGKASGPCGSVDLPLDVTVVVPRTPCSTNRSSAASRSARGVGEVDSAVRLHHGARNAPGGRYRRPHELSRPTRGRRVGGGLPRHQVAAGHCAAQGRPDADLRAVDRGVERHSVLPRPPQPRPQDGDVGQAWSAAWNGVDGSSPTMSARSTTPASASVWMRLHPGSSKRLVRAVPSGESVPSDDVSVVVSLVAKALRPSGVEERQLRTVRRVLVGPKASPTEHNRRRMIMSASAAWKASLMVAVEASEGRASSPSSETYRDRLMPSSSRARARRARRPAPGPKALAYTWPGLPSSPRSARTG